ncbi:MAG: LPS-assembly protein LptD, partial [Bosea sp. (in: a-proteobacteria)]
PFMSGPDATVKRKTGLLAPHFVSSGALGFGMAQPFFWNLAPNYDLTLTPTVYSRQGFLGQAEWRHRLESGSYSIRAAGIHQLDPSAFRANPLGARDKDFRGSIETVGKFHINDKWNIGWDIALSTDRWFFQNYRIRTESLTSTFFRESTSTFFLNGKSDTAWFDARGYYFRPLTYTDWQKQQPLVHPVLDYNKRFAGPGIIGGEFTIDANITSLSREAAAFQELPRQTSTLVNFGGTSPISLYEGCAVYKRGSCLVRGLGGEISRATIEASWRRNIIDPIGQVWTPFASVRADGFWIDPDVSRYANANVSALVDTGRDSYAKVMPAVGLTYRFPLVAHNAWGTHIVEPIAQIIARPNETHINRTPNEDAQSLVFDDANLFSVNKFSGYDRVEGGVRANVGAQYTGRFSNDGYLNMLFGQSFHLAGTNSFSRGDLLNTGLDSGLQNRRSDYVARAQFAPNAGWLFAARARFDETSFSPNRVEVSASRYVGSLSGNLTYARYERQPHLGLDRRREGLYTGLSYKFNEFWKVSGSVLFDMDRYIQDRERYQTNLNAYLINPAVFSRPTQPKTGPFVPANIGLSVGYKDECTTFELSYLRVFADRLAGAKQDSQTFLLKLELRTLGQATVKQSLGSGAADGISQ